MMSDINDPERMSRRDFVKTSGLLMGSMAVPPLLPVFGAAEVFSNHTRSLTMTDAPLKIGILLPHSVAYPAIGANLLAGMNLYFSQAGNQASGREIQIVEEAVGLGQDMAAQKAQKLLVNNVDLVVGLVNTSIVPVIHDLLQAQKTFFISASVGANVPREEEHGAYFFRNSLSYWQANMAMGQWAANNLGRKAFIAASFYDSGYDAPYAFRLGFEQAGGRMVRTYLSHVPPDRGDFRPLFAHVEETQPDFVYGMYCGQSATDFVQAYAGSSVAGRIPLAGSGFMVDEHLLPVQGTAALGIKTCLPWSNDLGNAENKAFASAYQTQTGRMPDIFAMLGFDTARMIVTAVNAVGGELNRTEELHDAFASTQFASPRGAFKMNPETRTPATPLYVREVQQRGATLSNVTIAKLDPISEHHDEIKMLRKTLRSGWLNPYLCV